MVSDLDITIRQSLLEFVTDIFDSGWYGREREAISLYVMGYLLRQCSPGRTLHDPRQIGIEFAVPQIPTPKAKPQVCKDLVIWPKPAMVCWDDTGKPVHYPLAILEWKVNQSIISVSDTQWLTAYSAGKPDFIGYAVCLDLRSRAFRLSCTKVRDGVAEPGWLLVKD